nr:hypothetical protein [Tanacetum cinerariifolium]
MGYEHLSITPEIESDEVTKSNAENLLPIPSECEVTLEDKRECDELICENSSTIDVCDNHSEILFDSNNDDLSSDDESFADIKYVDASVPDPAIVSVGEENVVHREEEDGKTLHQQERVRVGPVRHREGDQDREVPVAKTFHKQTDEERIEKEEIWLRVQQMMNGSDIGIQEKKDKLFNEWEMLLLLMGNLLNSTIIASSR